MGAIQTPHVSVSGTRSQTPSQKKYPPPKPSFRFRSCPSISVIYWGSAKTWRKRRTLCHGQFSGQFHPARERGVKPGRPRPRGPSSSSLLFGGGRCTISDELCSNLPRKMIGAASSRVCATYSPGSRRPTRKLRNKFQPLGLVAPQPSLRHVTRNPTKIPSGAEPLDIQKR